MHKLILLAITALFSFVANAQLSYNDNSDEQPIAGYFAKENPHYNKSIIYVFYRGQDCQNCAQTISLIEELYNQDYKGIYDMYVIDYTSDDEYNFVQAYNLSQNLEVVLVPVYDGRTMGFQKVEDLNNQISDPKSLYSYLEVKIDDYFSDYQ